MQYKVLAPSRHDVPRSLVRNTVSSDTHLKLMTGIQKLRGKVYREYEGIAATLLSDGRHCQGKLDEESWHILLQDSRGEVRGCARYRPITDGFEQLTCSKSSLAKSATSARALRLAFEQQFELARQRGGHFGEAGAWAIDESARCSTAAVNIALMSFALAARLGAEIAVTTATTRHASSAILKRLGAQPFGGFEPYFEPMFGCEIEVLQLDMTNLQDRYLAKLAQLQSVLADVEVICPPRESDYCIPVGMSIFPTRVPQFSPFAVSA